MTADRATLLWRRWRHPTWEQVKGACALARDRPGKSEFVRYEMNLLKRLPPFDAKSGNLNVVIDTPKGCRSKFAFDMKRKAYVLKSMLPHGTVFPFDFGSIPGTVAADGDPGDPP